MGPSEISIEQINNSTETATYLHHDQAAGFEAGRMLGEGAGKTALNVLGGVVGGSAIVGGTAIVSAAASEPSACGCS